MSKRTIHKMYDDNLFEIAEQVVKNKEFSEQELIELASLTLIPLFKGNLSQISDFLNSRK